MYRRILLVLAPLLILSGTAGGEFVNKKDTLKGISKFYVIIEDFDEKAKENGLSVDILLTNTELALRMAGIEVVSNDDPKRFAFPYLYVHASVFIHSHEPNLFAYSLNIQFKQVVTLINGNITIATTWDTSTIGFGGIDTIRNLPDDVKRDVDIFLNDYLAVNPKK